MNIFPLTQNIGLTYLYCFHSAIIITRIKLSLFCTILRLHQHRWNVSNNMRTKVFVLSICFRYCTIHILSHFETILAPWCQAPNSSIKCCEEFDYIDYGKKRTSSMWVFFSSVQQCIFFISEKGQRIRWIRATCFCSNHV
jgi:hypothetical protein